MNKREIMNQGISLYNQGKIQDCYDFITEATINSDPDCEIHYIRFSLASVLGHKDLSIQLFKEAVVEHEFWYATDFIMQDPDLENMRTHNKFSIIQKLNNSRSDSNRFVEHYREDIEVDSKELFIALHGNQQSLDDIKYSINKNSIPNAIISYPRATQQRYTNAYIWNDLSRSIDDVNEHYKELKKKYNISDENITISSFSASGSVLLKGVLEGKFQAKNLIFFGPWLAGLEKLKDKFNILKENNTKIYIVCGELDEECLKMSTTFSQLLEEFDIPHKFDKIPGLGHDIPGNLKKYYPKIIAFFR